MDLLLTWMTWRVSHHQEVLSQPHQLECLHFLSQPHQLECLHFLSQPHQLECLHLLSQPLQLEYLHLNLNLQISYQNRNCLHAMFLNPDQLPDNLEQKETLNFPHSQKCHSIMFTNLLFSLLFYSRDLTRFHQSQNYLKETFQNLRPPLDLPVDLLTLQLNSFRNRLSLLFVVRLELWTILTGLYLNLLYLIDIVLILRKRIKVSILY